MISKWVSSLVWDGARLFRYSGPVQGHFTSHDSGELPHICFHILRLSRSGQYDPNVACSQRPAPAECVHMVNNLVDPQLYSHIYPNTCISIKWQPFPWVLAWTWEVGTIEVEIRMVNIYILIITEQNKHCTMYSGRNYTILNVLWLSESHVNAKYGHVKNDVIFHRPSGAVRAWKG